MIDSVTIAISEKGDLAQFTEVSFGQSDVSAQLVYCSGAATVDLCVHLWSVSRLFILLKIFFRQQNILFETIRKSCMF